MADLDTLFSRLKAQQNNANKAEDNTAPVNIWQQGASPTTLPRSSHESSNDQKASNSLLDLLNIRAQAAQPTPQRATSSFTLPAADASQDQHSSRALPVRLSSTSAITPQASEPSTTTQKFLLDLLTKPKSSAKGGEGGQDGTVAAKGHEDILEPGSDVFTHDSKNQPQQTSEDQSAAKEGSSRSPMDIGKDLPPLQTPKKGMFTYINPFDELRASSPLVVAQEPAEASGEDVKQEKTSLSVAEKLENVGHEVDNQAEQALTHAESADNGVKDDVESNWSTAEDDDARLEEEEKVEVYNFPLKPFIALTLNRNHLPRPFRLATSDKATPVARLKKDFSHDDRSLVTASQTYIIYSVPPTDRKPASGLKLIRQDDGKNKHLWSNKKERICSVQISSAAQNGRETILATGVNGTMYSTTLPEDDADDFATLELEKDGIVMSPPPNSDEPAQPTDTPSIRTRAKLSNRKPTTYFAVARGRHIHFIGPELAKEVITPSGDSEQYLSKYSFCINIAKACKDFTFSEDDTVIASLDKLGKVKFWDIQPLTKAIEQAIPAKAIIKDPLHAIALSPATSKAESKSSPTSIMFLDKDRTHAKRVALRYMLVGFQQNHILQLWDLGLGKCVQELRLPDAVGTAESTSEESKGMCSVVYHSKSSIIVVGHPGRNSIFLIHLSAPKYNLNPLSQSAYLAALANQDLKTVPKPENTAILSGIREFSCDRVGQLRSLDILRTPFPSSPPDTQDEVLFEIYLMHSKGVLGIPITRDDLGWDAKGKLVKPADAVEKSIVVVSDLADPPIVPEVSRASSTTSVKQSTSVKSPNPGLVAPKTSTKSASTSKPAVDQVIGSKSATTPSSTAKPTPQPTSKSTSVPIASSQTAQPTAASQAAISTVKKATRSQSPLSEGVSDSAQVNGSNSGKTTTNSLNGDLPVDSRLQEQFSQLYKRLDNDKRISEAAGAAKQDAILRLVSSTLTDNVESSLQRIVVDNIQDHVLPAINQQIQRNIASILRSSIPDLVRNELSSILPGAINGALSNATVSQSLATAIANAASEQIKNQLRDTSLRLENSSSKQFSGVVSGISDLSNTQAKSSQDVRRRLEESEERVTALLTSIQEEQSYLRQALEHNQIKRDDAEPKQIEPSESPEVKHLTQLLNDGKFEQATVEWLQSNQQAELFDQLFVRINPEYLKHVSSLVALSVSAAVTASLESNIDKRLEWLGSVISNVDVEDQEIHDVAPKIMDVLVQRLLGTYMQVSETQPNNQEVLRKLAALSRLISNTRKSFE